jgi:dipeptidyl aminopeptidase/acylaminoacyl peptidase
MHNSVILSLLESPERHKSNSSRDVEADSAIDPEALIREARDHQRRRRQRQLAGVLALAVCGAVAYAIVNGGTGSTTAIEHVPNGPTVATSAFSQHGRLAFISRGRLWLLDGKMGKLRQLKSPPGFIPVRPMFSPDGKWLAYLQQRTTPNSLSSRLWLARADGTDAHVVSGFSAYELIGWRPRVQGNAADLLAVATGPVRQSVPCPCWEPTTLRLVSSDSSSRVVAVAREIYGAAWSPGGTSIAVAEIDRTVSKIVVQPLSGGPAHVWLRRAAHQYLNGMNEVDVQIAGWSRHLGVGFWVYGGGMIHNNDAAPLDSISTAGSKPRVLGQTLSDGTTDQLAASTVGEVAVVTDHGGGRIAWQGKRVVLCTAVRNSCLPLPRPSGTVTVDPSWSPNGKTLAYVVAPNVRTGPWTQRRIARWFTAHRVFIYDIVTHRARELTAARGATAIHWSSDSTSLLYVHGNALWLLPTLGDTPVQIAAPLFRPGTWPQYYAQIAWADQFAWSPR